MLRHLASAIRGVTGVLFKYKMERALSHRGTRHDRNKPRRRQRRRRLLRRNHILGRTTRCERYASWRRLQGSKFQGLLAQRKPPRQAVSRGVAQDFCARPFIEKLTVPSPRATESRHHNLIGIRLHGEALGGVQRALFGAYGRDGRPTFRLDRNKLHRQLGGRGGYRRGLRAVAFTDKQ